MCTCWALDHRTREHTLAPNRQVAGIRFALVRTVLVPEEGIAANADCLRFAVNWVSHVGVNVRSQCCGIRLLTLAALMPGGCDFERVRQVQHEVFSAECGVDLHTNGPTLSAFTERQ